MKAVFLLNHNFPDFITADVMKEAKKELQTEAGKAAFIKKALDILEIEYLYLQLTQNNEIK